MGRISKKVFTTVCDDDKANMEIEDDYDVPDLKDILAIFGVTNSENEIPNDVEDDTQTTTTTTESELTTTPAVRKMDSSKIVFSDASINARNKELADRDYVRRILNTTRGPAVRNTNNNSKSQIFFPE